MNLFIFIGEEKKKKKKVMEHLAKFCLLNLEC